MFAKKNKRSEAAYCHGMRYYDQGNFRKAHEYFKKAADYGYGPAYYKLGRMYENGYDGQANNELAYSYYIIADIYGNNVEAQNNIGTMYLEGLGIEQDIFKARSWFIKSANQGCPEASYNLGAFYESYEIRQLLKSWDGMEVVYKHYRDSASLSDPPLHETGDVLGERGVDEIYLIIAANWYRRALELGDEDAQNALDRLASENNPPVNN